MVNVLAVVCLLVVLADAAIIPEPSPPNPIPAPPTVGSIGPNITPESLENSATALKITTEARHSVKPAQMKRIRAHSNNEDSLDSIEVLDEKCNDLKLREIMTDSMSPSLSTSKMVISERSARDFGASFDVICARGLFSYFVDATQYCEVSIDGITCFAYRSARNKQSNQMMES